MLFTLGHGQHVISEPPARGRDLSGNGTAALDAVPITAVIEGDGVASRDLTDGSGPLVGGPFNYYFGAAPEMPHSADTAAKLDGLAVAMLEPSDDSQQNSSIPPVFTYFGQFIDHDITANTDRETGLSVIDDDDLAPVSRNDVVQNLGNLRNGALELDSIYGDGPDQGPFSKKLTKLMRHPTLKAKMRLGVPTASDGNRPPLPADPAADLLRLGRILGDDPRKNITVGDLDALEPALKKNFVGDDGKPIVQKAIIGDARNDENLIVAQLHTAVLRFHNKVVDAANSGLSGEELFEWARQRVRWHYQWLIVNSYLPTICDPAVVSAIKQAGAPLYSAFFSQHATAARRRMPLPLEFSVAGFRFGHSMVRAAYDHNRFFGRSEDGSPTLIGRAPFDLLFAFTGNGHPPMPKPDGSGSQPTLPNNWIIEWDRFVATDPSFPDRSARMIDTHLAEPLTDLANEPVGLHQVLKHLAKRNLRRGHKLNIPSAQDCIEGINATNAAKIVPLTPAELTSGPTGQAVQDGGFASKTPLWFYVLKEAEVKGHGAHLGHLGSTLVAETLIGLVVNDKTSYWHEPGSDYGHWHPKDSLKVGGQVVDSLPAFFKAAGVL